MQSRVRFGVPSTQMGQGSLSAEVGGGGVEGVVDVGSGAAVPVVVDVDPVSVAAVALFSATFSACSVLRRAE